MSVDLNNILFPFGEPKELLTLPFTIPQQIFGQLSNLPFLSGVKDAYMSGTGIKTLGQADIDEECETCFYDVEYDPQHHPQREHSVITNPATKYEVAAFGNTFNERAHGAREDSTKSEDASMFGADHHGESGRQEGSKEAKASSIF